jgi:IclR family pca regulon transcriptional regulator
VDQELEEGLRALAAPVRDAAGRVVAAVNVSAPVRRGDVGEIVKELLPAILRTARSIEEDVQRSETLERA